MARRSKGDDGCLLGVFGILLGLLLSDNKRDNKIGVGIIVGAMILIGLAGAIGPDAAAALLIFGGIAFVVVCVIAAFTGGGKNNNSTVTTAKTKPPSQTKTDSPKIKMPQKDTVSDTANFDAQFAEMEKQINSVIDVPNQPKEPIKPVQSVDENVIPAPPIPSSSPVKSAKVEIKAYEPEEEEEIDNVLMSMWYEDEIKEIYKKLKQLKSGEITESDYQSARTQWLDTYRDREPNDNRYNQQVEALREMEMED